MIRRDEDKILQGALRHLKSDLENAERNARGRDPTIAEGWKAEAESIRQKIADLQGGSASSSSSSSGEGEWRDETQAEKGKALTKGFKAAPYQASSSSSSSSSSSASAPPKAPEPKPPANMLRDLENQWKNEERTALRGFIPHLRDVSESEFDRLIAENPSHYNNMAQRLVAQKISGHPSSKNYEQIISNHIANRQKMQNELRDFWKNQPQAAQEAGAADLAEKLADPQAWVAREHALNQAQFEKQIRDRGAAGLPPLTVAEPPARAMPKPGGIFPPQMYEGPYLPLEAHLPKQPEAPAAPIVQPAQAPQLGAAPPAKKQKITYPPIPEMEPMGAHINPAMQRAMMVQRPEEQPFNGNQLLAMLMSGVGGENTKYVNTTPRQSISDKILRHFGPEMYSPERYPEEEGGFI